MIALLIPLRWWRGGAPATPTYVDAPAERYVWAPPQNDHFEAAPWFYGFTPEIPTPIPLVAGPISGEFVPPDFGGFVAPPYGGSFTA